MKKKLSDRNVVIVIIIILILILLILGLIFGRKKTIPKLDSEKYNFSDSIDELPNTETYTNDKLKESHCIDGICVEDVTLYYDGNRGRIEYNIYNKSKKNKSGYLKMFYGKEYVVIRYKDLEPGNTIKGKSSYKNMEISDKDDYVLKKMTNEEIKSIKK